MVLPSAKDIQQPNLQSKSLPSELKGDKGIMNKMQSWIIWASYRGAEMF